MYVLARIPAHSRKEPDQTQTLTLTLTLTLALTQVSSEFRGVWNAGRGMMGVTHGARVRVMARVRVRVEG